MRKSVYVFFLIILLTGQIYAEIQLLSPETLRLWFDRGERLILIDLRDRDSFKSEHIPGAINIPADEIQSKIGRFRGKKIVLYCWSEGTSRAVAKDFEDYNIFVLEGGIDGWKQKGYKVSGKGITK